MKRFAMFLALALAIASTATAGTKYDKILDKVREADDDGAIPASAFTQDGGVLVGTGAGTYAEEAGATLRTSVGVGTTDTPQLLRLGLGAAADGAKQLFLSTATATDDQLALFITAGGAGRFLGNWTAVDLTGDQTWTFQDATGTVVIDATACSDLEGTGLAIAAGVLNFSSAGLTWAGNTIGVGVGGTGKTTIAQDTFWYASAADTFSETSITAAGRAILDDADAATQRATLGLGTIATQAANSVAITGGSITGITDLAVADGGTGLSAWTQYAIPWAPTTGSLGNIAIGAAGEVLTVNGTATGYQWTDKTIDTDVLCGVDAAATAGYLGAGTNDGILRTSDPVTLTDGGDFITLGVGYNATNLKLTAQALNTIQDIDTTATPQFAAVSLIGAGPDVLTLGNGGDIDYGIYANGNTSQGRLKWMEDEMRWETANCVRIDKSGAGAALCQPLYVAGATTGTSDLYNYFFNWGGTNARTTLIGNLSEAWASSATTFLAGGESKATADTAPGTEIIGHAVQITDDSSGYSNRQGIRIMNASASLIGHDGIRYVGTWTDGLDLSSFGTVTNVLRAAADCPIILGGQTFRYASAGSQFELDAGLAVAGVSKWGDGGTTNYANVAADGTLTLVGTARVTKEIAITNAHLGTGGTKPTEVLVGNYLTWEFDIADDAVFDFELPPDWATGTDLTVNICWQIDEAYATNSGEVNWQVAWSATPEDNTEAIDAPTHSGTITSGDINIPANAKYLIESNVGTIAGASLAAGDAIGITFERIALVAGTDPTADPGAIHVEIEYTADKLGE